MRAVRLSRVGRVLALLGLLAGTPALAQPGQPSQAVARGVTVADHVAEASRRFGVPERWIWAVMRVESNGDAGAVSPAGAMGLMQIMPDTWATLRARYRLGADPFDRRDNILAGTAYLREMHDRFGSPGFLAAYNAGPNRYAEYLARGRSLPAETRAYLVRLAPVVGGSVTPRPAIVSQPDRDAWTRAALFPQRSDDRAADESPTVEAADTALPAPGDDGRPAPNDTVFVALTGQSPQ